MTGVDHQLLPYVAPPTWRRPAPVVPGPVARPEGGESGAGTRAQGGELVIDAI